MPGGPGGPEISPDTDIDDDNGELTPLYRAVNPDELADLLSRAGLFALVPGGLESKDFALNEKDAKAFGKLAEQFFKDGPYTVVGTAIPTEAITPDMVFTAADLPGGLPSIAVPGVKLILLTPAVVLE